MTVDSNDCLHEPLIRYSALNWTIAHVIILIPLRRRQLQDLGIDGTALHQSKLQMFPEHH